jgi:phosphonate transport system substrate-binding protein
MRHVRLSYLGFGLLIALSLVLSACTPAATATPAPTAPVAQAAPTTAPTAAPTAAPTVPPAVCDALPNPVTVKAGDLGSADNPLVMAFVPSGDAGKIAKASSAIADCLGKMTGLSFKVQTGTSYAAAIEAMGAGKAQIGFLSTFAILIAEEKYGVIPALANLRKYSTNDVDPDKDLKGQLEPFYKGQFIASDPNVKQLTDLKGKSFCFVDPTSASGYIIPRIQLKAAGVDPDKDFKATTNAGSHPNVAIAVYKGDCDAGITFIDVMTDAAANLKATYPDITDKVHAFADTVKIPNDGVQYVKTLDPAVQKFITSALMAMSKDPGGKATLASLYSLNAFQEIDASFYNDFANLVKSAGYDPATFIK